MEHQVVAVRPDQRDAALHLAAGAAAASSASSAASSSSGPAVPSGSASPSEHAYVDLGRAAAPGHRVVRAGDGGAERRDQGEPAGQQLRAVLGQVAVPDVEGAQVAGAAGPAGRAGGLQQRVALLEHPVVVGPDPGEPRGAR